MRFLRLSLLLFLTFALLLTSIHLIAGARPNSVAILFTNPDGSPCKSPCLLGVNPDAMSVDQALAVLTAHPLVKAMRPQKLYLGVDQSEFVIELQASEFVIAIENDFPYSGNAQQIHALVLRKRGMPGAPSANPQLVNVVESAVTGDFLAYLGSPDTMGFYGGGIDTPGTVTMHMDYAKQHLSFASFMLNDADALRYGYTLNDPLFSIVIVRHSVSMAACKHWYGFISLENFYDRIRRSGERC